MSLASDENQTAFVVWYDKLLEEWFVTEQEDFEQLGALQQALKEQRTQPKVVWAQFPKEALDQVRPKPVDLEEPFFNTRTPSPKRH